MVFVPDGSLRTYRGGASRWHTILMPNTDCDNHGIDLDGSRDLNAGPSSLSSDSRTGPGFRPAKRREELEAIQHLRRTT